MIKIFVRNTSSQLSDYTEELEKLLTCPYPNYWFAPKYRGGLWDGQYHFLKIPSLRFPSGLLFLVEKYFRENDIEYEINDLRTWPKTDIINSVDKNLLKGIQLRDYQQEAILAGMRQKRGIFEIATGLGKTEISIAITKLLKLPTLFVVHTQDLLHQTKERFEKRLDMKDKIGILGDNEYQIEFITVATVQTLHSLLKREQATAKELLNVFQVVFFDEVHHASSMEFWKVGMFMHNAVYRWGLSGTPLKRNILSNMKVLALTGDIIYSKSAKAGIDDKYLSNIKMEIIENPEEVTGKTWQQIYKRGIVESGRRNGKIIDIVEREFKNNKRIMLLIRYIKHGEILQHLLKSKHIPAVFLSGRDKTCKREEFKTKFNMQDMGGRNFVLISSVIFQEGVDIPNIQVLIIASGGSSEVQTIQRVGRGLRIKEGGGGLLVYDFNDKETEYLDKHSRKRIRTYKAEGFM